MTRAALIIGDGRSGGGPLPGVEIDHQIYRTFLTSDAGGAWNDEEIIDIDQPVTAADLDAALAAIGTYADYSLVIFSGHGGMNGTETYLCINDSEIVAVRRLLTGSPRQLTILDACRIPLESPLEKAEGRIVLAEAPMEISGYRARCRASYDELIVDADSGYSVLYACSPGGGAGDDPSGGVFSNFLVHGAEAWAATERTAGAPAPSHWRSVSTCFVNAVSEMKLARIPQLPVAYLGKRAHHFPFVLA
jgi:hypothetical protein